jgi:hypothetical protein
MTNGATATNTATFINVKGIAINATGSIFFTDTYGSVGQVVRMMVPTSSGASTYTVYTVAGSGTSGTTDGYPATFNQPWALAVDSSNNLYVRPPPPHVPCKRTAAGRHCEHLFTSYSYVAQ